MNPFHVANFDDLLNNVQRLSKKDQKDLAEDILRRLEEEGWEVDWSVGSLSCKKTEEL